MQSISLSELLEWKETRKFYCWPLLPTKSTMFFAAPPKMYKTILAMQFAYCLVSGQNFFGYDIDSKVDRILYLEQEIGRPETRDRMARMHAHFKSEGIQDKIRFVTRPKQRFSLDIGTKGFEELENEIKEFKPQVVFIDPFRKITSKDENSSTEMTKVFAAMTALQEQYDITFVVVHHSGKPSDNRKQGTPDAMRGSSEIFGHGDTYGMLVKPTNSDVDIDINFEFRHAPHCDPLKLTFDQSVGVFVQRVQEKVISGVDRLKDLTKGLKHGKI